MAGRRVLRQLRGFGVAGVLAYGLLNSAYYSLAFLTLWWVPLLSLSLLLPSVNGMCGRRLAGSLSPLPPRASGTALQSRGSSRCSLLCGQAVRSPSRSEVEGKWWTCSPSPRGTHNLFHALIAGPSCWLLWLTRASPGSQKSFTSNLAARYCGNAVMAKLFPDGTCPAQCVLSLEASC